jgi:selenocysteine lyase/cysteine desulfurase
MITNASDITRGLDCQRAHFAIPAAVHYLNCAYMGPLPLVAQEAGIAGIRRKALPTEIAPRDFFEDADRARVLFAGIIGAADANRVAIVPAVSYGAAIVAHNLRPERGSRVVVAAEQFPSNVYAWRRLAGERQLELHTVSAPAGERRGENWNDALLAAIDARTTLVALPHVHWTDGTRFDLEAIGAKARQQGAVFVVDATQSIGALPFDVTRIGADAVLCAGYKWLLGPYGLGYTWFGPRFDSAAPIEETWIGRRESEDFRGLVAYRDDYQPGAARMDVGERSNFILLPMAVASLQLLTQWRADRIQDYCTHITAAAVAAAEELGFVAEEPAWRAAHLFGLRAPPGVDIAVVQAALAERNIYVSLRGSAIRVSPNVYNDGNDMSAFAEAIRAAAAAV